MQPLAAIGLLLFSLISTVFGGTFLESDKAELTPVFAPEDLDREFVRKLIHGEEYYVVDDMLFSVSDAKSFGALTGTPWPGGILYFKYDRSVTATQKVIFANACLAWSAGANIQCTESSTQPSAITIYSGNVNQSKVGCCAGPLTLYNWNENGVVEHELAHALGMIHEQSRSDRDDYVRINIPNIVAGALHNYDKVATSRNLSPYDYHSIMHYGLCDFSINPNCMYIPNDPNEPAEKKTIVPVLCNTDLEAQIGTHGNRAGPPTPYDLMAMAAQYGVAVPLAALEFGRTASCPTERMTTEQKEMSCDRDHENCGLNANSRLLSATEVRKDKWCDDSFMTRASCANPKEMTYLDERKGARCGWTQTNHVRHREYHCSCVAYQVFGSCHSGTNGLNSTVLERYKISKNKTELAVSAFVAEVEAGIGGGAIRGEVHDRLETILMVGYPSKKYARWLQSAAKTMHREVVRRKRDQAEKGSIVPLTYDDVRLIVTKH